MRIYGLSSKEGKIYKEAILVQQIKSDIKILAKNKECGRIENKRFIDIAIGVRTQIYHHLYRYILRNS